MARSYDNDLRFRVINEIEAGHSARSVAKRFQVGTNTAVRWIRLYRETGSPFPKPRGNLKRGSKIDPYSDFILKLIKESCDITLSEIKARLSSAFNFDVSLATLSRFFRRHKITLKKNFTRR